MKTVEKRKREAVIISFAKRLFLFCVFRRTIYFLAFCFFLWGLVILILRRFTALGHEKFLYGGILILPVIVSAFILERKHFPLRTSVRALLDIHNNRGGLLMAEDAVEIGEWEKNLSEISCPRITWHCRRAYSYLAAGSFFLLSSFLVPKQYVTASVRSSPLDIKEKVGELEKKIETIEEEELIEEEEAMKLKEELEKLAVSAKGEDPVSAWEALDHLEERVSETAKKCGEEDLAVLENLGKAEGLAAALAKSSDKMGQQMLKEALAEMKNLLESEAMKDCLKDIPPEMLSILRKDSVSSAEMMKLCKYLGQFKNKLLSRQSSLCEGKLIDMEFLGFCEDCSRCDSGLLAALLAKEGSGSGGSSTVSDLLSLCSKPGRGGITRGRGDAPMSWSQGTDEKGIKFTEKTVPPSAIPRFEEGRLMSVIPSVPSTEGSETSAGRGGVAVPAGPADAYTQTVLPRHRSTIRRYFETAE